MDLNIDALRRTDKDNPRYAALQIFKLIETCLGSDKAALLSNKPGTPLSDTGDLYQVNELLKQDWSGFSMFVQVGILRTSFRARAILPAWTGMRQRVHDDLLRRFPLDAIKKSMIGLW